MKKSLFLLLLISHSAISSAVLTKNDVLSVSGMKYYLDGKEFAEISWNKFDINWLFWEEVYAGRTLTATNEMVKKQNNSLKTLAADGFKTIRFFGNVHPANFYSQWWPAYNNVTNKAKMCDAAMDKAIEICEANNIRAIVSLMCDNFVNKEVTPAEDYRTLISNPNSQSRKDLYAYLTYTINKYKDRKGVLAWEVSNEMTLDVDVAPGIREMGVEKRPNAAELNQFFKDVCAKIKSIDKLRMVTSGGSVLREHAYGLSQIPQSTEVQLYPKRDTWTEHKNMYSMYYKNTGFSNVDIHFYMKKAPNYQIRDDKGNNLQLTALEYNKLCSEITVPLMMGEYGALPKVNKSDKMYWLTGDDWFTTFTNETDTAQLYVQQACDNAVNSGCRLIYWWCYDSHRKMDQNDPERMDLEKTRTPKLYNMVKAANAKLKKRHNIIADNSVITNNNEIATEKDPMAWMKGDKLIFKPECIGKVCRIYNGQGALLHEFTASNEYLLNDKGMLIIKIENQTIRILKK
jgi:hypothetical protein